jgi:NAD(P)-dependent dehydrogenase (short-subunit alcohol dehydrogenase family)
MTARVAGGMDLAALTGGVAVITGSGSISGLGFGLAKECAKRGMHVCISDVRQNAIDEAVALLATEHPGVTVAGCACDVTDYSSVEALVSFARSAFGGAPVQFVGANAGVIFPRSTILSGSPAEWALTFKVNVLGLFHTLRAFVPVLLEQEVAAAVEVTASVAGVTRGGVGPYGTSKLAALGIAEGLSGELVAAGAAQVSMVSLCPVRTIASSLNSRL